MGVRSDTLCDRERIDMKRIIIALAMTAIAGCSSYDTSGAGATSPYGGSYDYPAHNSAL